MSASRMRFVVDNSKLPISLALLSFARFSLFLCPVPLACHCSIALALALALFLSRRCAERRDATRTRYHKTTGKASFMNDGVVAHGVPAVWHSLAIELKHTSKTIFHKVMHENA